MLIPLMDLETELKAVETHEELEDWNAKFRLHLQAAQADSLRMSDLDLNAPNPSGTQRRPSKGTKYSVCVQARLKDLASKLVLPAEQFAENVSTITVGVPQGYSLNEVKEDKGKEPIQLADIYAVPDSAFHNASTCLQVSASAIINKLNSFGYFYPTKCVVLIIKIANFRAGLTRVFFFKIE